MGSESVGEIFRPERKNLGGPLPEPVRLFSNQSRGDPCYHKPEIWQVARSCHPIPQSWDVPLDLGSLSLACEQFWGRAVQASWDSLDPGRFLFVQIPKRTPGSSS